MALRLQQVARKLSRIEALPIVVNEATEISTREAHTLQAIGENTSICVRDLAARFGVSKSAASQMVSKLTREGFIQKQPAPHSNRELLLSLTPLGRQAFHAHERAHGQDLQRIVDGILNFSAAELATLEKLLAVFSEIADERLNTP